MTTDTPDPSTHPGAADHSSADELVRVLTLEHLGTSAMAPSALPDDAQSELAGTELEVYRGESQPMPHGRVFGGQVLAQSVMAAGLTLREVEERSGPRPIHSLHAYFIRPGDDTLPITFTVERMRDGASFSARRVHAIQHGQPILSLQCSFQTTAGGLDHQEPMPDVPGPEGIPNMVEQLRRAGSDRAHWAEGRPVEQRHVEGTHWPAAEDLGPEGGDREQHVWMRVLGTLPDDPLLHAAALAYASDYALLEPVLRHHGIRWGDERLRMASLDHAMWFHRPARADDWVLYSQRTESAQGGRGLGAGTMYTRDGVLACTVVQEGMVRVKQR